MSDPRDPQETLLLLIRAAGNADAVRLASLIHTATGGGVDTFHRRYLVHAWQGQWGVRAGVTAASLERRVNRAVPVLVGVGALMSVGGPDLRVDDVDVLEFLADRVHLAEALDVQAPDSNTLPVGEGTRARAVALVPGAEPGPRPGPPPGELGGVMILSVSAEVVKGTPAQ